MTRLMQLALRRCSRRADCGGPAATRPWRQTPAPPPSSSRCERKLQPAASKRCTCSRQCLRNLPLLAFSQAANPEKAPLICASRLCYWHGYWWQAQLKSDNHNDGRSKGCVYPGCAFKGNKLTYGSQATPARLLYRVKVSVAMLCKIYMLRLLDSSRVLLSQAAFHLRLYGAGLHGNLPGKFARGQFAFAPTCGWGSGTKLRDPEGADISWERLWAANPQGAQLELELSVPPS